MSFGRDLRGANLPSMPSNDGDSFSDDPCVDDFATLKEDFVKEAAAILGEEVKNKKNSNDKNKSDTETASNLHRCQFWKWWVNLLLPEF
jgi:hypothetical protein